MYGNGGGIRLENTHKLRHFLRSCDNAVCSFAWESFREHTFNGDSVPTQEVQSDNRNPTRLHKDPVGIRVVDRHSDP